jgi:alpha-tubulin suppressor-like RCC1 family protein
MIKDIIVAAQKTPPVPPVYLNELWGMGQNSLYPLGLNDGLDRSSPVQVGTDTNWSSISSGQTSFAIKTDGTLWSWGANSFQEGGDMGVGDTINRSSPVQIGTHTNWKTVTSKLALKTDGTLWSWGRNDLGQVGLGDTVVRSSPVQIGTDTNWAEINNIYFNLSNAAIKTDGTLWVWGYNDGQMLGLTRDNAKFATIDSDLDYTYINRSFTMVSMGKIVSYAIGFDGTLWGWGSNANRAIGDGTTTNRSVPTQVGIDTNWSKVIAGKSIIGPSDFHNFAIKTDGTLWGWGNNSVGQLGLLDIAFRSIPTQIGPDTNWSKVSAGTSFTIAIKTDGTLWSWGSNTNGTLGLRTAAIASSNRSSPVQIGTRSDWTQISSGTSHTIAIRSDGTLWAWGNGSFRQLGITTTFTGNRSSPTQVGVRSDWTQIAAGYSHSMAISSNGTLWSWGGNADGQLGIGVATGRSSPVQVGTRSDWTQVDANRIVSSGLRSDGTLWSWGDNSYGNLGLGVYTNRSSPTQVGTLNTWASASSIGLFHSGVIDNTGIVYTAGYFTTATDTNNLTMGRRSTDLINRSSPTQLGNDTNWSKIFAGGVLQRTDGSVWGIRSSPVQLGTETNWASVTSQYGDYTVNWGIKTDGTLWRWNINTYSQVGTDSDWKTLTSPFGGYVHFTKTNGTLWFWGMNNVGQGGFGDTIYRSSPTQVGTLNTWVSASNYSVITHLIKRYT